jgi:hypothetical protein
MAAEAFARKAKLVISQLGDKPQFGAWASLFHLSFIHIGAIGKVQGHWLLLRSQMRN